MRWCSSKKTGSQRFAQAQTRVPADARLIDLRPLTGIPGMIDVHTHMTFYWDKGPRLEAVDATRYPQLRRHRFS